MHPGYRPERPGATMGIMTSAPPLSWTVSICRGVPGAADAASVIASQGAAVRWCGPDCACGQGGDGADDEEGT